MQENQCIERSKRTAGIARAHGNLTGTPYAARCRWKASPDQRFSCLFGGVQQVICGQIVPYFEASPANHRPASCANCWQIRASPMHRPVLAMIYAARRACPSNAARSWPIAATILSYSERRASNSAQHDQYPPWRTKGLPAIIIQARNATAIRHKETARVPPSRCCPPVPPRSTP